MKPVHQSKFGLEGNCLSACVASIFDLSLDAVPDFVNDHGAAWVEKLNDWLRPRSLFYFEARYSELLRDLLTEGIGCGFHLIGGKSPRDLDHVVVGYRGEMVHDPHPSADGLTSVTDFGLFIARLEAAA